MRRIRSHWPTTQLTIGGDGHYGRPEVMAWCEANGVDYIFGLPGNAVLSRLLDEAADDVRVRRAEEQVLVLRRYAEIRYGAKSWAANAGSRPGSRPPRWGSTWRSRQPQATVMRCA